jgi:hypothetical protein
VLVVAGCLIDFSFGVFLNAHVQSLEESSGRPVFGGLEFDGSAAQRAIPGPDALSDFAWMNWFGKHHLSLTDYWLVQLPEKNRNNPTFESGWPAAKNEILKMRQEDEDAWGGWYARHNGEIQYIGDHVVGRVGEALPVAILFILLIGLITALITQTPASLQTVRKTPKRRKVAATSR